MKALARAHKFSDELQRPRVRDQGASHRVGGFGLWSDLKREGLPPGSYAQDSPHEKADDPKSCTFRRHCPFHHSRETSDLRHIRSPPL
ncbi:hypothetical protein ACOMHN_037894 [Nucella lapillus]